MYVCTTCSEHFTRKYSATRHIITIHGNRGQIVPLIEFLVGRNSGKYQASHPFWYRRNGKRIHKFGQATVADYCGDTFRPSSLQQETTKLTPLSAPHSQPPDVLPYQTDQISEGIDTITNDYSALSQETTLKIQELDWNRLYTDILSIPILTEF